MPVQLLSPDDVRADHLSPDLRAQVCNGIGPALGRSPFSWLAFALSWPFLVVAKAAGVLHLYKGPGDDHDARYAVGGTQEDKRSGDGAFLADNLAVNDLWPTSFRLIGLVASLLLGADLWWRDPSITTALLTGLSILFGFRGWAISFLFTLAVLVGGRGSFTYRKKSPYPIALEDLEDLLRSPPVEAPERSAS